MCACVCVNVCVNSMETYELLCDQADIYSLKWFNYVHFHMPVLEISNWPLAPPPPPPRGLNFLGQVESLRRLPPGTPEILEHEIFFFMSFLKSCMFTAN